MLDIEPVLQKLAGEHLKHKVLSHLMMLVLTLLLRIFGAIVDKGLTLMLGFSIPFVLLYTMSHYHSATAVPKWKRNDKGFVKSSLAPFPH